MTNHSILGFAATACILSSLSAQVKTAHASATPEYQTGSATDTWADDPHLNGYTGEVLFNSTFTGITPGDGSDVDCFSCFPGLVPPTNVTSNMPVGDNRVLASSEDLRFVAVEHTGPMTNSTPQVLLLDRLTQQIVSVSHRDGVWSTGNGFRGVAIDVAGSTIGVTFSSDAANLGAAHGNYQVFASVFTTALQPTSPMFPVPLTVGDADCVNPIVDMMGPAVIFESASNNIAYPSGGIPQVYYMNLANGATGLVSYTMTPFGPQLSSRPATAVGIHGNGTIVTFTAAYGASAPMQLYGFDLMNTAPVAITGPFTQCEVTGASVSISGTAVAFTLQGYEGNIMILSGGELRLVSGVDAQGHPTAMTQSGQPRAPVGFTVADDGTIAFTSDAENVIVGQNFAQAEDYRHVYTKESEFADPSAPVVVAQGGGIFYIDDAEGDIVDYRAILDGMEIEPEVSTAPAGSGFLGMIDLSGETSSTDVIVVEATDATGLQGSDWE